LQRAFDALLAQGVDGIVLAGGIRAAAGLKEKAAEQGVPLVCVARSSGLEGVDVVRPDNMQAAKLATEFLIKRGHSQIAYLGGQSDSLTRAERLGGFCATLVQYGLPFRSEWIVECDCRQREAAEAAEQLLRHYPNITAIVCHKASVALGAYFWPDAQRPQHRLGRGRRLLRPAGSADRFRRRAGGRADRTAADLRLQLGAGSGAQCRCAPAAAYR
jgi:LacI family transcriptional regulator of maltose regulon